ncbi:hypothetical protein NMG60_11027283 [Bertholletia excelsa]
MQPQQALQPGKKKKTQITTKRHSNDTSSLQRSVLLKFLFDSEAGYAKPLTRGPSESFSGAYIPSIPSSQFAKINPALYLSPKMPLTIARNVAVVGAGAAGLIAARELRQEGHRVVVFEREDRVGGTWLYDQATEPDPLGLDSTRPVVHSSLYASLRTNLPREVMGFLDFPFVATEDSRRDPRRFPGHREVLEYLNDFTDWFGLEGLVRFESEVMHVGLVEGGKWEVRSENAGNQLEEVYDAVVVCNGHYTEPRIAEIPGIETWPGKQIHSHNYRVPEPFHGQLLGQNWFHLHCMKFHAKNDKGMPIMDCGIQSLNIKVVILIGGSASAADISRELAGVAKEVHIASRSVIQGTTGKLPGYDNVWLHSMIESVHEDGTVKFQDGGAAHGDTILHCTGYKFHFPFLDTSCTVSVEDNRVGPLYQHVFPPLLAPWLSFVGLPWQIIPFPLFELQSKWVAGVLSNRIKLPSSEEMMEDVKAFYKKLEESGMPKRYTHQAGDYQFEYTDWLAAQCKYPPYEEWRKQMFIANRKNKRERPETYRDEWDDHHLISLAHEDFTKYCSKLGINGFLSHAQ